MAKVLYIEASPRKDSSYSVAVARHFLSEYQKANPEDLIDLLDLWNEQLPSAGGDVAAAKYSILSKAPLAGSKQAAWDEVADVIARFKSADKYVLSVPMWNFSVPYVLKHYIDLIVQPGYTFTKGVDGKLVGLLTDRPMICITASGSKYEPGSLLQDFQRPYLEWVLGFIGFKNIQFIAIAPTTAGIEAAEHATLLARREAEVAARAF
jgi:FMN-dependent NADH-azoreductase